MPRKLVASTAVALVVGCFGLVAADAIGVQFESAALSRALSRRHISFSAIEVAPLTGQVTARGIGLQAAGARIEIGTLRLPAARLGLDLVTSAIAETSPAPGGSPPPTAGNEGNPAASTTTADDVVITRGQATYRIKHIEMAGTSLSSKDLAALLDMATPESLESRLRKISATAIVIPEIVSDDTTPGSERHTTTRQVLLANVRAGKASATSAAETTFSFESGDDTIAGTVGSVEGANVDLAQAARVFGTVRTDDNEPILPLYDKVVVNKIAATNETNKGSFTIGSIVETGAKARALKTDLLAGGTAAMQGPVSDARSAALLDDLAHSFEIGGLEIDDVSLRNEAAAGLSQFDIAHAAMRDFANGRIGGLEMRGFRGADNDAKIGIGTLEIGAFALPKATTPGIANQAMALPGKIEAGEIDADIAGNKGKPARVRYRVERIAFAGDGTPNEIPAKASFAVDHMTFDVSSGPSGFETFPAMGYNRIDLSAAVTTTYDAANQDLKVDNLTLSGVDMGSASLGLHLVNVTRGIISSNKQVAEASAIAVLAKGLDLKIKNGGLFEKEIALKAQRDGMTVAQERDLGIDFFAKKLPASLNDQPGVKAIGEAVAKFIADPRTLHIAIESKTGLGIGALGMLNDPSLLLDTLEIKASADD